MGHAIQPYRLVYTNTCASWRARVPLTSLTSHLATVADSWMVITINCLYRVVILMADLWNSFSESYQEAAHKPHIIYTCLGNTTVGVDWCHVPKINTYQNNRERNVQKYETFQEKYIFKLLYVCTFLCLINRRKLLSHCWYHYFQKQLISKYNYGVWQQNYYNAIKYRKNTPHYITTLIKTLSKLLENISLFFYTPRCKIR